MSDQGRNRPFVIYVDDDTDDLFLIEQLFLEYAINMEMLPFNDSMKAYSFLKNLPGSGVQPCLIILDINLPGISGKELLVKLRNTNQYASIPIVLFSTSSSNIDKDFAYRYNAGFITKPLNFDQMGKIIGQFIELCADDIKKFIRKP
ncbi:MAG TPA: response regulator [Flavisolibacter sp.]|nr:response regulator [Flavisolibacter sp.]